MATKLMTIKYMVNFSILMLFYISSQAQSIDQKYGLNDTLGIAASAHEFDSLVGSLLKTFRSDSSTKEINDYLLFVKVANTIYFNHLYDSSATDMEFGNLFFYKYLDKIVKLTDAKGSIGLSFYSKKYDLQIGGLKTRNNCYRIIH